jgi:sucrose-6F-phosphate phosphohydrolase
MFFQWNTLPKFVLASDLDGTLVGCKNSLIQLNQRISECRLKMLLIYITGRTLTSARQLIDTEHLLNPDILITDVGTEIHIGPRFISNAGWETKVSMPWNKRQIEPMFAHIDTLIPQGVITRYRLAYTVERPFFAQTLSCVNTVKEAFRLPVDIIPSLTHIIDIVPEGACKGSALSFLQKQIGICPEQIIVCGDSGNDHSMFNQGFRGIVVGNACLDFLNMLANHKGAIYLSPYHYAAGIMDGLMKYGILS